MERLKWLRITIETDAKSMLPIKALKQQCEKFLKPELYSVYPFVIWSNPIYNSLYLMLGI